ncbi:Zn-ribbon domain-containing OB-fold protein [Chloroflexota bacterium]
MSEYTKQLPETTGPEKPFWDAARNHELTAYRCTNCGTFYSRVIHCVACDNPKMDWVKVSGKGEVFTFGIFHQVYHPGWKDDVPYNVSWIKLDEGPLVMSNVVDCKHEDLHIGMPVEVVFEDVNEEVSLPKFKPAK